MRHTGVCLNPDLVLIMKNVKSFLGEGLYKKYTEIIPILTLIIYRMGFYWEGIHEYERDFMVPYERNNSLKHLAKSVMASGVEAMAYRNGHDRILVSDTLLCLDRCEDLLCDMMSKHAVVSYLKTGDYWRSNRNLKGIQGKRWETRTIYVGDSVPEKDVEKSVRNIRLFFDSLIEKGLNCTDSQKEAERLFSMLKKHAGKRIDFLYKKLKKNRVTQFITINQYNLRDVLTVMACRKAGIVTKELSHYSYCITPVDQSKRSTYYEGKLFFTDEGCVWNISEKKWYEKYVSVNENIFGDSIRISCVGCPEITRDHFNKLVSKIHKQNSLIYFVPSVEYIDGDYQTSMDIRKDYFKEVYVLSERLGVKVYVRYHPCEPQDNINREKDLLSDYNFIVCPPGREKLNEFLCESKIAITCKSSVAIIAHLFGCKVYNIIFGDEQYDYMGMDFENIKLGDIESIELPESIHFYPEECIYAELLVDPS